MKVSYDKDVRSYAEEHGKDGLITIDIYPFKETRITFQAPASTRELNALRAFWMDWMKRRPRTRRRKA